MRLLPIIYLAYMFIGLYLTSFFLLLYAKNRNRLFTSPTPARKYSVSVLISAFNEEESIAACIKSILNSSYKVKEVIVVNDGSTDGTRKIVEGLQKGRRRIRLLNKKNTGKADSLNKGLKLCDSELVVIVDADSSIDRAAIEKMIGFFNDKKMAAVTGLITPKNKGGFIAKLQSYEYPIITWTRKLLGYVDSIYVTPGALSMYRKEVLLKLGGFDRTNLTEDIEMTWRLAHNGYKREVSVCSRSYTVVPETMKHWWRQRTRWNLGGLQTLVKYRSSFFKKGMLGFFILPFFTLSLILGLVGLSIFFYLIARRIFLSFLVTKYSISANISPLVISEINLTPSVLNFFGIALFSMGLFFTYYALVSVGEKNVIKNQSILNLFFYLIVYLTLYPLVLLTSVYRYAKGDIRWGTK